MEFEMTPAKASEFVATFVDPDRAKTALRKLHEGQQFAKGLDHPISQLLLSDALARREELLLRLVESVEGDEEIDKSARMEYKIINSILRKWAEKICKYMEGMDKANKKIIKRRKQ